MPSKRYKTRENPAGQTFPNAVRNALLSAYAGREQNMPVFNRFLKNFMKVGNCYGFVTAH